MKTKTLSSFVHVLALSSVLSAASAHAAILASENFGSGHATGELLHDTGSGSGWAANWTASNVNSLGVIYVSPADRFLTTTTSHNPSGGDVGSLDGTNNRRVGRNLDTSEGGAFGSWLDGSGNVKAEGETIYVAWTWGVSFTSTQYYGFEMHRDGVDDGYRILQLSNEGGAVNDGSLSLRARTNAVGTGVSWTPSVSNFATLGSGDLYVLAITYGANGANDSVNVYVNPLLGSLEGGNTPVATLSGVDLSFDRISFSSFANSGSPRKEVEFDDIVIASDWAGVVGVPETGSLLLCCGALGVFGLLRRR